MAERRMFAKTIIDSDAFLDMPLSSQALYFHLSMRADDEGFINNPKKIQRMIGASDDDLKILIGKNFLIPFESGIVVVKHWRIHNYIQSDRFKKTVYIEEREQLSVKDNKAYTLNNQPCIHDGYMMDTQDRLGKDSIDKDRLGKDSIDKDRLGKDSIEDNTNGEAVQDVVNTYMLYCPSLPSVKKITDKRKKAVRALLKAFTIEEIKEGFAKAEASDFCKGKGGKGWIADFDFLTNQNNLAKVLEGKYDNRTGAKVEQSVADRWANVEV